MDWEASRRPNWPCYIFGFEGDAFRVVLLEPRCPWDLRWPLVAAARVVQSAAEWVRQGWAVPPLAAERRRGPLGVAPPPVGWAAAGPDCTTPPATGRLGQAAQSGKPAAS